MIGQTDLKKVLLDIISDDEFPVFSILHGLKGSGKKLLVDWIASKLDAPLVSCGISVTDVRQVITDSHLYKSRMLYFFPDADKMSNEAKSALLKITEEPPNNCHIIMSIESLSSMPATIISRAQVFRMDLYKFTELKEYADTVHVNDVVCQFCETPGDIDVFKEIDVEQFLDYVDLVLDNISQVGVANSLKIGNKIALKENAEGYDLRLFWKAFIYRCMQRAQESLPTQGSFAYAAGAMLTSKYVAELSIRGVNKNMLFLDWVLKIREEWV